MNFLKKKAIKHLDLLPIYVVLMIVVVINAVKQPNFFTLNIFINLMRQLSPYVFMTMAQTLIMIIGGVDFSVGALVSLSTCVFATNLTHGNWNIPMLILIILACGTVHALVGFLVSWFELPLIVVTFATSFIYAGLALIFLPTAGGTMPPDIAGALVGRLLIIPVPLIVMTLFVLIWVYIRRSSIGLLLFAVGKNKGAAYASGLNVNKAYVIAFFLSGIMSAMAGIMLSAITMSGDPRIGTTMTIDSITAAILGGVSFFGGEGKIAGALAGAVVIGMLVNVLFYLNITGFYTYIVRGVILILAVALNVRRKKLVLI